jgi:nucleotide-binding universal stress UspA family protein
MRILVPVDGSAASLRALDHALSLVKGRADAELVLVNVQSRDTLDVSDFTAVVSADSDRALATRRSETALKRAVAACRKGDVHFETRAELGPVAETIDRVAREVDAEQIVMGTRGLGKIGRLFLGSIAAEVTRLAAVPVTLVK